MCAGEEAAFQRAQPILQALGQSVRFLGPAGRAASQSLPLPQTIRIAPAAAAKTNTRRKMTIANPLRERFPPWSNPCGYLPPQYQQMPRETT